MLMRLSGSRLADHKRAVALLIVLQAAQTAAVLYLPTLNADLIDNGVVTGDIGHVVRVGCVMLAVTVFQVLCVVGAMRIGVRAASAIGRDIRLAIFRRVQEFSAREVGRFGAPSLVTRTTNDVQQVQTVLLLVLTTMVTAPLTCVGAIVLALVLDVPLAVLLAGIVPVLAVEVAVLVRRSRPLFGAVQRRMDDVNRILGEQISGVRVIRAFVRDEHERRRFGSVNAGLADVAERAGRLTTLMFPLLNTCVNVFSVPIVWFGALLVDAGDMRVGTLTAFLGYLALILTSAMMANGVLMALPRADACAERIEEVLATEADLRPSPTPIRPAGRGELALRGVTFGYPGAESDVLRGVDLVGRPGETTAVIGPTGSGKTTLLSLVARLFDVTAGQVLVDGVDVRDIAPDVLADLVALVPQRPYLFAGTVASNLRYARPDATDDELRRALAVAQVDFVGDLEAPVAQGGTNLSGGQRQRLTIARALLRRARIYLFDDCCSALDRATEQRLWAALAGEVRDATVVTVTQRVSTVSGADRIVVLDDGRVVGTGTHRELLAGNEIYREVALSQDAVR